MSGFLIFFFFLKRHRNSCDFHFGFRLRLVFNWLIYAFAGYLETEQVQNGKKSFLSIIVVVIVVFVVFIFVPVVVLYVVDVDCFLVVDVVVFGFLFVVVISDVNDALKLLRVTS